VGSRRWDDDAVSADRHPVVVAAARTPITASGGALAGLGVEDLAAPVLARVAEGLTVGTVVLGNCMGPGGNVARVSALAAGLPVDVAALTVDQQCASGLGAIAVAASMVASGGGVAVAGGVESASTAPIRMRRARDGEAPVAYDRAPFAPVGWPDPDMGYAADVLAEERGIPRLRQDEYAARSHARAVAAQRSGAFDTEIVEVGGVLADDRPRDGFGAERLARFPAAFRDGGTVTAANSCGINDGSAAVALVDSDVHARLGVPGLRIVSWASVGVDPGAPGLGIVPAAHQALDSAGLRWADVDVIEFNKAFASQILACCDELGLDDARVCAQGGALALGHPWGASGAVLMTRLFHQLVVQGIGRTGLAAIAGGGGQGVAMVVQRCP